MAVTPDDKQDQTQTSKQFQYIVRHPAEDGDINKVIATLNQNNLRVRQFQIIAGQMILLIERVLP